MKTNPKLMFNAATWSRVVLMVSIKLISILETHFLTNLMITLKADVNISYIIMFLKIEYLCSGKPSAVHILNSLVSQ
jgi:hypothetical protein